MVPGMKFAALAQCPVFGGKVGHVDDSAAKKVPGVRQIVVLDDLVAVVGDHTWAAKKGLDALVVHWDEGANATVNTSNIWEELRAASKKDGVIAKSVGDIGKGLSQGDRFDARLRAPVFGTRANGAAKLYSACHAEACEIWTGTQVMTRVQKFAAEAAGPADRQSHRAQSSAWRRLRPPAGSGHGRRRCSHR